MIYLVVIGAALLFAASVWMVIDALRNAPLMCPRCGRRLDSPLCPECDRDILAELER